MQYARTVIKKKTFNRLYVLNVITNKSRRTDIVFILAKM